MPVQGVHFNILFTVRNKLSACGRICTVNGTYGRILEKDKAVPNILALIERVKISVKVFVSCT